MPDEPGLKVYNIGSGQPIVLKELINLVVNELQQRGLKTTVAYGARSYRAGEPMVYMADIRQLARDFSWEPATSLQAGVHQTVEAAL